MDTQKLIPTIMDGFAWSISMFIFIHYFLIVHGFFTLSYGHTYPILDLVHKENGDTI
jgi:hypothetical protein